MRSFKTWLSLLALLVSAAAAVFSTPPAAANPGLQIRTHSVDGGAATSDGNGYVLRGVIAQPDAGRLEGDDYSLEGGVLPTGEAGILFCDGFESGDVSNWSFATP